MVYDVNGIEFKTQKDLSEHVKRILNKYKADDELKKTDCAFMTSLLSFHPKYTQIYREVESMFVMKKKYWGHSYGSKRLSILRKDGNPSISFLPHDCIENVFNSEQIRLV